MSSNIIKPIAYCFRGSWTIDLPNDVCEQCKKLLIYACPKCEKKHITMCQIYLGSCNHAYHSHCLDDWNKENNIKSCPADGTNFKIVKTFNNDNNNWINSIPME